MRLRRRFRDTAREQSIVRPRSAGITSPPMQGDEIARPRFGHALASSPAREAIRSKSTSSEPATAGLDVHRRGRRRPSPPAGLSNPLRTARSGVLNTQRVTSRPNGCVASSKNSTAGTRTKGETDLQLRTQWWLDVGEKGPLTFR